jgi:DNA polymerase-3 subunit beta
LKLHDEPVELITIGALARASGLTASALRFYADCGLLSPVRVDPDTGYRYYSAAQLSQAALIRQLRQAGVPLDIVTVVLSGDAERSGQLLDGYVAELRLRAQNAAIVAESVKQSLGEANRIHVPAPALAEAIQQVRSAAASRHEHEVLTGLLVQANPGALVLTATDQFRLATRTIAALRQHSASWSLTSKDLLHLVPRLSAATEAVLRPTPAALAVTIDGEETLCQVITGSYPDYQSMLAQLGPVRTRVVVSREPILSLCENSDGATVSVTIGPAGLTTPELIAAKVTGPAVTLHFDRETLRPAISGAVGPEIMLDISGPDQPVIIRSATDGDLTTLVMPRLIPGS